MPCNPATVPAAVIPTGPRDFIRVIFGDRSSATGLITAWEGFGPLDKSEDLPKVKVSKLSGEKLRVNDPSSILRGFPAGFECKV